MKIGKSRKNMNTVMSHSGFGDCFITVKETTYIIPVKKACKTKLMKQIMHAIRHSDVDTLRKLEINFVTKA